ncbi:MAG: hypothetical protein KGJ60_09860 [Verrucomicrobiota bacterium]|nr:hypothetical protein [Verrucomicrobiota bacterium]
MKRIVQPELLDLLPAGDPRILRTHRDLHRINAMMGNPGIMAQTLRRAAAPGRIPGKITELGAGDGHFLLRVAQGVAAIWPDMNATLLDRRKSVSAETLAAFAKVGWRAEAVVADVFDGLAAPVEVVVANLFLHHLEDARLAELFRAVAVRARLFVGIEPRRGAWPLFCCRWLWMFGCSYVTRHDAVLSVRAGFSGLELSGLWPADGDWQLAERRAGPFSHLFVAQKTADRA